MRSKKITRKYNLSWIILIFLTIFFLVFFGVQFFTKTGIFKIPGTIFYDDSLSSIEKENLLQIFNDEVVLDKNLTIVARNVLELTELSANEYLDEIYVPVTDFYSANDNLKVDDVRQIYDSSFQTENNFNLITISDLDFKNKLLKINSKYFLDDFNAGAVYRIISFESEKFEEEIKPLVDDAFTKKFPSSENVLTFAQTGVTALARRMNNRLREVDYDATYFAKEIGPFLSKFDLTHTSNEASFSDYANSQNICSDERFIDTLTAIGLDIVELTGNHNQDCGDEAAAETIDTYLSKGIKIVGGGKTADEARKPLEIAKKNSNITMLAFNQSTGGATLDNTPGANQYYEDIAKEQIKNAKENGNFVIVDIQYYECNAYASTYEDPICDFADSSAGDQIGFFRHLIELGADIVVGTSAHQPQTFELYQDGVIYYGLGNLFFDQTMWPGTTRSLVLAHYFYDGKLLQTRIIPTVYNNDMQTKLLDEKTTKWFLERLISARP